MANDTRQQFVFRREWYEMISTFSDDVRFELYEMIMEKVFFGEVTFTYSAMATAAFKIISMQIDNDFKKATEISEKRREAGRIGGEANGSKWKQNQANGSKQKQTEAKEANASGGTRYFQKPTIEEVRSYISEKGYHFDAESFFAFYESKGWKVGNQPMKSWQAACVTWEKKYKQDGQQPQQPQQQKPVKPRDPNDPDALSEYYQILKENQEREKARSADEDKRFEQRVIILNYMSAHKYDYLDLKIDEVRENEYFTVTGLKDGTQYWVCKVGNCKRRFYMDYRTNKLEECKVSAPFRPNNDFVWDRDNNQWVEGC